jgi:hypothetical protein
VFSEEGDELVRVSGFECSGDTSDDLLFSCGVGRRGRFPILSVGEAIVQSHPSAFEGAFH